MSEITADNVRIWWTCFVSNKQYRHELDYAELQVYESERFGKEAFIVISKCPGCKKKHRIDVYGVKS